LDLNGNGVVTIDEFRQHPIPHGEHDEVFRRIDANGDGAITQAEFANHRPPPPPEVGR
jgi:Ca2+-binding EF-hand superfamily protein